MRYLFQFAVLLLGFLVWMSFAKSRPSRYREPPPRLFATWSRQARLIFVWVSTILLALIIVPAAITFFFLAIDANSCRAAISLAWACEPAIRLPAALAVLALVVVGVLKGGGVLSRVQNYGGKYDE
jgi:hypothetical protein